MIIDQLLILVLMLFLHIINDFNLQGILASMKQKEWWKQNANDPLYKNDYKISLWIHCYSWSFCIMIPEYIYFYLTDKNEILFLVAIQIINMIIHYIVDDLKANKKKINLVQDQLIHIMQIIITWIIMPV